MAPCMEAFKVSHKAEPVISRLEFRFHEDLSPTADAAVSTIEDNRTERLMRNFWIHVESEIASINSHVADRHR